MHTDTSRKENHNKFARLIIVASIFLTALFLLRPIFAPLALSIILSMVMLPLARWFERRKFSRILSSFLSVIIPAIFVSGLFTLAYFQLTKLSGEVTDIEKTILGRINSLIDFLPEDFRPQHMSKWSEVGEMMPEDSSIGTKFLSGTFTALSSFVSTMIIIPVFMVFTLIFRVRAWDFIKECDKVFGTELVYLVKKSESVIQHYIGGLGLVTLIIGTLATVGLWIIGIPYALLFGICSALLAVIPYIGTFVGALIPALFAFAVKDSYAYGLAVMALYLGIQLIDNNFISPYILGNQVNINPLASVLALTSFYMYWGLIGTIIAIPVIAILQILMLQIPILKPFALLIRHSTDSDEKEN